MSTVTVNGVNLACDEGGAGPAVVYIHGGFASLDTTFHDAASYAWTWENDFASRFHLIEYERRGCFRSSCPAGGYDLPNQARDLECLLDHLGVGSAHIIGSSAGGPVAIVFAATRPQRVRSLVLSGSALTLFPDDDPVSNLIRRQIAILEREGAEAAFDQRPAGVEVTFKVLWEPEEMKERGTLNEYRQEQAAWAERAALMPRALRVRYYAAELRNMKAYMDIDIVAHARRLATPTLVLHGSNDREAPVAWGEEMAHTISGARLHVLPGESHTLVQRSAGARQVVMAFFDEQEARHV